MTTYQPHRKKCLKGKRFTPYPSPNLISFQKLAVNRSSQRTSDGKSTSDIQEEGQCWWASTKSARPLHADPRSSASFQGHEKHHKTHPTPGKATIKVSIFTPARGGRNTANDDPADSTRPKPNATMIQMYEQNAKYEAFFDNFMASAASVRSKHVLKNKSKRHYDLTKPCFG